MKQRRSLTHVGGDIETAGDRTIAAALAHALDVPVRRAELRDAGAAVNGGSAADRGVADDPDRAHVHGFHTYPARMHPTTAGRLVHLAGHDGASVLDPFCGSGTVAVETMIAGMRAVGTDLNPLAVQLARLKTARLDASACAAMVAGAARVAAFADVRRKARAGASRRYGPEDVALFEPHVLLELDSLRVGIAQEPDAPSERDPRIREALGLVLSAILVKLSRRTSDTSAAVTPRRIAAGFAARLFTRKTEELARRIAELGALLPSSGDTAHVGLDDAMRLRSVGASTIDAVVTSPPYAATYDYVAHHALRLRWLGLDVRPFSAKEMGSRRHYAELDADTARATWASELGSSLSALARVCRKGGRAVFVIADSAIRGQAVRADATLVAVAPAAGFTFVARASQRRPHFHGPTADAFRASNRAEHAILLEKR